MGWRGYAWLQARYDRFGGDMLGCRRDMIGLTVICSGAGGYDRFDGYMLGCRQI
ncbi:hypothetical protein [Sporosarcina psychrophila]|uniref:Uncharacterized protein n=1 Tax=Sporosarcina psychrophila TaxID=1476 RepID=A0ABV2K911_SPOPS